MSKIYISNYHNSKLKIVFNIIVSTFLLLLSLPLILAIAIILKTINNGPVFFIQKRVGKNGKVFKLLKFRTMRVGAEKSQKKYLKLNEADGPIFKIYNDPRLTPFGKILFQTGLDELPQFINVIKGDMSLVGPRPLPTYEAEKLSTNQKVRELIKPGITSSWVIQGSHALSFKKWMDLDKKYVEKANLKTDLSILLKTFIFIIRQILNKLNIWTKY